VYNNEKIQKIIYIQNRREVILATLEVVKKKLINWRKATRKALNKNWEEPRENDKTLE